MIGEMHQLVLQVFKIGAGAARTTTDQEENTGSVLLGPIE